MNDRDLPVHLARQIDALCLQFEQAWRAGCQPTLEDYQGLVPDPARHVALRELIALEVDLRRGEGDQVDSQEYQARFPDDREAVEAAFELLRCRQRGEAALKHTVSGSTAEFSRAREDQPQPASEPGEVSDALGRYHVQKLISRGGFGDVYLAVDTQLNRNVALKVPRRDRFPSEAELSAFLDEARTTVQLEHPGVVPVYDVFGTATQVVIVQRYLTGGDLATRLKSGTLPPAQAASLLATIAEAVAFAHCKGFIHRDLKPSNILLDEQGQPLVADFGLALHESAQRLYRGDRSGTRHYRSPEQVRGEAHRMDGRSDIWSLGVMLYEMLSGRRPFATQDPYELDDEILYRDPWPLRMRDISIPAELDRICQKCLSKRVSERYSSAAELAEDLTHWMQGGMSSAKPAVEAPLVPRGLRSFDEEDAESYLDLLPGPKDRTGLPESIRFWKTRIEQTAADRAFPVGMIYGPSGCGKSSLVKAGLLPRLAENVIPVYVEATADDTVLRLLKHLRRVCPDSDADVSLPEFLGLIREGRWLPRGKKVLLILDQFEQWLHAQQGGQDMQLVEALRQCDGTRVQSLLLVRDDFWSATSRFMRDLEIRPVDGENLAFVDRFDLLHAQRVLAALGQAYGRLPAEVADWTEGQKPFLERVVTELAQDGKVVCVRLALFADMMQGRAWNTSNLRRVGGAEGLGVTFLEEMFGDTAARDDYRCHQKTARAVLQALLPETVTDIKGGMRSYVELLEAAGGPDRAPDFDDVVRMLDGKLRLITPTAPEARDAGTSVSTESGSNARGKYYQLTHDYLVPALREWLTRKQKETRRGRAEVCLAERAAEWNLRRDSRHLPSLWESLTIGLWTKRRSWTDTQHRMLRQAGRFYTVRVAAIAVLLSLVGWGGYEINGRYQAATHVARLLSAEIRDVPAILPELEPYFRWAKPQLVAARGDSDPKKQLHASLALLSADARQCEFLRQRLLEANPEEGRVICQVLGISAGDQIEEFWDLVTQETLDSKTRFRAACALACWAPQDRRWHAHAEELAAWLVSENPLLVGQWIESLRPVATLLVEPLSGLYRGSDQQQVRSNALVVLAEYHGEDWGELLNFSGAAKPSELPILASSLRRWSAQVVPLLRAELAQPFPEAATETDKDAQAKRQANAGMLLGLLDATHVVWPHVSQARDPRVRTCLVHGIASAGVDPAQLASRLTAEKDAAVRRTILWSLGQYEVSVLTQRRCDELAPRLVEMFCSEPDAGLHSSIEWLLRKWGYEELLTSAEMPLRAEGLRPDRDWYLTSQGHTLAIVRGPIQFRMGSPSEDPDRRPEEQPREKTIDWSFAIATQELSLRHYRQFAAEHQPGRDDARRLESPVGRVSLMAAMEYCRWLTEQEGLPESEMCYERAEDGSLTVASVWLTRKGYRLPTETEWEYACRAGTTTRCYFGHSHEYLDSYAWYWGNSDGSAKPCGLLLPNDLGLFDTYGNVAEWCQDRYHVGGELAVDLRSDELSHSFRGGDYGGMPTTQRSAARAGASRIAQFEALGFRLARTIP